MTDKTKDPNKLFLARLGQGGERALRILLSKDSKVSTASAGTESGVPRNLDGAKRRRPADEIIPRRRVSEGLINFWDLGQILDGAEWVDLPYETLTQTDIFIGAGGGVEFRAPNLADWQDMIDLIFEVDIGDWEDTYRPLTYEDAEKYGVDFVIPGFDGTDSVRSVGREDSRLDVNSTLITGEHWTEDGFQLGGSNFGAVDAGVFQPFGSESAYFKITSSPSYAASAVSLSLTGEIKIFLVPRLMFQVALARDFVDDETDYNVWSLVGPYRPYSRVFWLDRTDPSVTYPMLTQQGIIHNFDATNSTALEAHVLDSGLTRGFNAFWPAGGGSVIFSEGIGSGMQYVGMGTFIGWAGGDARIAVPPPDSAPVGALVAVIKKGSSVYYVWQDATLNLTGSIGSFRRGVVLA